MTRMFLTMALALFVGISTTYAQDAPKKKKEGPKKTAEEVFKAKDKNADGVVTIDEFVGKGKKEGAETRFKAKDKDGDGKLTLEEFTAKKEKKEHVKKEKKPKKEKAEKSAE